MGKVETFITPKVKRFYRPLKECPRCGPGVHLAEHKDRWSCGKCGYTEWKK